MVAGQIPIAATATSVTSSVATLVASFMPAYTGDVTSPAGSTVNTLATGAVTYAKQQNVTAARLIGNPTGSLAAPSEISLGTNLSFAGTVLNATAGAGGLSGMTAGQIPIAATATTVTSSGNLSGAVTTSNSLATTMSANAVATTNITNANVTYAKIQNVTASRLLGNPTGSAAAPLEISLGTNLSFTGTVLNTATGIPRLTVSDIAPGSPTDGDLWFDSVAAKLYIRFNDTSDQWVPVA
jgi:hypothetical protein